ncbi:MAG: hypothetical protein ACE5KH_03710, partial [Candidatus Geothermarchaeales archaeon]
VAEALEGLCGVLREEVGVQGAREEEAEVLATVLRLDQAIRVLLGEDGDEEEQQGAFGDECRVLLLEEGVLVEAGYGVIPRSSKNPLAADFLGELLQEENQAELLEELGKYPVLLSLGDNDVPVELKELPLWLPIETVRSQRIRWPHYRYVSDLTDLWISLFEA